MATNPYSRVLLKNFHLYNSFMKNTNKTNNNFIIDKERAIKHYLLD